MSIITGFGLPSFVFIWGDIINGFSDNGDILDTVKPLCLEFLIIGIAIWITSYFYYTLLVTLSERVG